VCVCVREREGERVKMRDRKSNSAFAAQNG